MKRLTAHIALAVQLQMKAVDNTLTGDSNMGDDGNMKSYEKPELPKSSTNPFKRHSGYDNLPRKKRKSK